MIENLFIEYIFYNLIINVLVIYYNYLKILKILPIFNHQL